MRRFLLLIIVSLFVSNVASAAMLCCIDIPAEKVEQSDSEMPCHGADKSSENSAMAGSQCDCEGCFQFATITHKVLAQTEALAASPGLELSEFQSLLLTTIYYPPRPDNA